MNWWAWVIGGGILLGSELAFVNAQFYLVFVGAAAMLTGLATLIDPSLPQWLQWAGFALLAVVSMLGFRARLYGRLHGHSPGVASGPAGGEVLLPNALAAGATCQVEHGGSFWTVRNDSPAPIAAGTRVRVAQMQGLTLVVKPD
jgi:membrane protein implicated in regulation of membrane protease activity